MTYRSDLDALEARHAALDAELAEKAAERDRARALLDDAKARLRLPVLDQVRVASPCNAAWDAMTGDDQVRHCAVCDKDVFNLSGMTREDAETLIAATNGALCARYYRRADGTILTADCSVGKRRARRRKLVVAGVTVFIAAGAAGYKLAQTRVQVLGDLTPTETSDAAYQVPAVPSVALPPDNPPPPPLEMGQMVAPVPSAAPLRVEMGDVALPRHTK